MKWEPTLCKPGDMIRIRIGSVYHYGIFVSDDEVIQFGYPPQPQFKEKNINISVCAVDIDTFSCGQIVETAVPDRKEKKQSFPPKKVIELARASLGKTGYNIIHNNCEHFAYECVFGEKKSTQEEELRKKWRKRSIFDIYISQIPQDITIEDVYPPERAEYISNASLDKVKHERYYVWKLLEYALNRSLGVNMKDIKFKHEKSGKWTANGVNFSLSHSKGFVACAVSNNEVGIDIENEEEFLRKHNDKQIKAMFKRCVSKKEEVPSCISAIDFMLMWTKKESIFKASNSKKFLPSKIDANSYKTISFRADAGGVPIIASACGKAVDCARIYFFENDSAHIHSVQML